MTLVKSTYVACFGWLLFSAAFAVAGDPEPSETVLRQDDFSAGKLKSGTWGAAMTDMPEEIQVVDAPMPPPGEGRALRLRNDGPTVWKPYISFPMSGEADSTLQLEFDFFLPAEFANDRDTFAVGFRGKGNITIASVRLGGPGGMFTPQDGSREQICLNAHVRAQQWNHLSIRMDPISYKEKGTFTVSLTQGDEIIVYEAIAFDKLPKYKEFPGEHWYSPFFTLSGKQLGQEVYLANVRLVRVASSEFDLGVSH